MKAKTYQAVKDALEIIIKQNCSETAVTDERGLFDVKDSDKFYCLFDDDTICNCYKPVYMHPDKIKQWLTEWGYDFRYNGYRWYIEFKGKEQYDPELEAQPCEDAISRKAVLDEMGDINMDIYTDEVKEFVRGLPSVQPKAKWIPVSERLPEDRREVLVTAYWHETYQVMMASYFGDGLWWCVPFNNCGEHMQRLKPKAWMSLPEPYVPQESEVEE